MDLKILRFFSWFLRIKLNIIIVLLVALLFVCACNHNNNGGGDGEIDWDSKTILNVETVESTFEKEYEYDEFSLDLLKLNHNLIMVRFMLLHIKEAIIW